MAKVEIIRGWCKKCGICVEFCPNNALGKDEDGICFLIDEESCTRCEQCAWMCPDYALEVEKRTGGDPQNDSKKKSKISTGK